MRKQANAGEIARKWLHHVSTKAVTPEQRQSIESWIQININLNDKDLRDVLDALYSSGYTFGQDDAAMELNPAQAGIDWDTWQAGNQEAANLVNVPNGLQELLDKTGITINGINNETMNRIGTALGQALEQGLGIRETANMVGEQLPQTTLEQRIQGILDNPARSLMIARTETARALIQGNLAAYRDAEVEKIEWVNGEPCEECAEYDGMIVPIGEEFGDGVTEPPLHPNCVCDIAPVTGFDPDSAGARDDL